MRFVGAGAGIRKRVHGKGKNFMRIVFHIVVAALLLFTLATDSSAQVSASIGGTVSDASGAQIPGVEVTAANVHTGVNTTPLTNEAGTYQIPSLPAGQQPL